MAHVLSIIIPAYNEEKAIEKTVRQFAALRVPHEVIVAVSPSTDQTAEVAKKCADNVIVLPPGTKAGVSPARNDGGAIADGKFLVFIDSDTYIDDINAFFGRLLERFADNPKVVGISVRINVSPEIATWSDRAVSFMMNAWFFFLNKVAEVGIASGKFIIVRADAFHKMGGFNEDMKTAEDVDLFRRLHKFGLTRIAWELQVHHEGRRFHKLGAWRTFFRWITNGISYWVFGRSSDTWEPVR